MVHGKVVQNKEKLPVDLYECRINGGLQLTVERRGISQVVRTERLRGHVVRKFWGKDQPYIPFHIGVCKTGKAQDAHGRTILPSRPRYI